MFIKSLLTIRKSLTNKIIHKHFIKIHKHLQSVYNIHATWNNRNMIKIGENTKDSFSLGKDRNMIGSNILGTGEKNMDSFSLGKDRNILGTGEKNKDSFSFGKDRKR